MRIINDPDLLQALAANIPYDLTVTVTPVGGSPVVIDADHMTDNGMTINPSSVSGQKLELGSVISTIADFEFFNHDGTLDGIAFKGAELHVEGTANINGKDDTFDIGYFIADDAQKTGTKIFVPCFDRMIKFDRSVAANDLVFPYTPYGLIMQCCSKCGVTLATSWEDLPNYDYIVNKRPAGNFTFRQMVAWCAQIMGRCAKINNQGQLELVWYAPVTEWDAGLNTRFDGGVLAENAITLTGVKVKSSGVTSYLAGADGYTLDIADNPLLQNAYDTQIDAIWTDIGPMSYYTANFDIIHNVLAEPFDVVNYTREDGVVRSVAVTDVVLNFGARTKIESKGLSMEEAAYAQQDPFTTEQSEQLANAGRLKIGRIESVDGKVYFDLSEGEIETNDSSERVTGATTKATYETFLEFKDGQFTLTLERNGNVIGKTAIGFNGLEIWMDETQGPSFPKPDGWDSWTAFNKSAWWVTRTIVADLISAQNTVNNSIIINNLGTPSGKLEQTHITSQLLEISNMDVANTRDGDRGHLDQSGLEAQKLTFSDDDHAWRVSKSEYKYDKAAVQGTIAALTGMKIGSADYDDPAAKEVATQEYVQNYIASLIGDYVAATGTKDSWQWRQWSSGKIECWRSYGISVAASSFSQLVTNLWYKDAQALFPTNMFDAAPNIQATAQYAGASYWVGIGAGISTKEYANLRLFRYAQQSSAATFYVHIYARGNVSADWAG